MIPFTLTIERLRVDHARVTVYARDESEAEERGQRLAEGDDVVWEDGAREVSVSAEVGR